MEKNSKQYKKNISNIHKDILMKIGNIYIKIKFLVKILIWQLFFDKKTKEI